MPDAARVGDQHVCPLPPHVGGTVLPPACTSVLIGGEPAARVGDMAVCQGPMDIIAMGEPTVLIGGQPAARKGDPTVHGGVIVVGEPSVLIGVSRQGAVMRQAAESGAAFCEKCPNI